jgi:hypothetical protein
MLAPNAAASVDSPGIAWPCFQRPARSASTSSALTRF